MKSISAKLIILLVIAGFVPLGIYGILSIWTSRHFNFEVVTQGNINVAQRAAAEIDLYVANSLAILNAAAQNLGRFNIPVHEQRLILSNYVLNFPEIEQIHITDRQGKQIISTSDELIKNRSQDIAFMSSIKEGIYRSDVFISKNLTPSMIIAVPIKKLNRVEGVAIADINLIAMWNLVDSIKIGKSGYAFVVSGDGRLIAHGLGEGKVLVQSNEKIKSPETAVKLLEGDHTVDIYKNIEGIKVIGVSAPIPFLGWTVIIEEPLTEAYASAGQMTIILTIFMGLFVIIASVTGYTGGGRYVLYPIHALIGATRRIAKGELDEEVVISTGDEFQEVGDAFNNMMAQLKILKEDIKRNERIAFMNKIAAGLVHDLRHPVKNIENSSRLIMKMYDREESRTTFNNIVSRELGNINRFLEDLLNLSRPLQLTPIPLNICNEITNLLETFREEMRKQGINIEEVFPDAAIKTCIDKYSMERVFKNIIRNAIEAMPGGGTLSVSVKSSDDLVSIGFRDTGPGIPEDKIENIFTDFTTTKGSGLGLGLAITNRIVTAHKGTITIESKAGKGTVVTVRLPLDTS